MIAAAVSLVARPIGQATGEVFVAVDQVAGSVVVMVVPGLAAVVWWR